MVGVNISNLSSLQQSA